MKSPEDIEKLIVETQIKPRSEMRSKVLPDALKVQEELNVKRRAGVSFHTWRTIMKSRITKITATAVIITAILVGINQFDGSIDGASVLYAQVRESIERKPWICARQTVIKGEKAFGGEEWFSLESKIIVEIVDDGRIKYSDFNHNRRYEYQPMSGTITISPIKEPPSFFEVKTFLGLFEKLIERKRAPYLAGPLSKKMANP